jgi:ankyrin repeat protein
LMLSASQGHFETAKHLLLERADPRIKSTDGLTALGIATQTGHASVEGLLLSCISDGKSPNSYFKSGAAELARTTSEDEMRIRVADTTNWTPLMHAAVHGNAIRVKTLINEGADTEASSQEGETALLFAARYGRLEAARSLVTSGANIDAITAKGWTPLMVAVRNSHEEMVNLLLSSGADVNHLSSDGWTALAEATQQGFIPIMEMLLRCRADTETKSQHDYTPLMHAAHKGNFAAARLLLDAGADWEPCSRHDEDAMLLAAAVGSTSIVRTLLDAGCPTEAAWASSKEQGTQSALREADEIPKGPDQRAVDLGWTPLMVACQNGHEPVVRMLLEAGANVEPRSPLQKTAREIAKENGRIKIFNILP